jgi:hypothetical protein
MAGLCFDPLTTAPIGKDVFADVGDQRLGQPLNKKHATRRNCFPSAGGGHNVPVDP